MKPIGIITDSSVQFAKLDFPGVEYVRQIPLSIPKLNNSTNVISSNVVDTLPGYVNSGKRLNITPSTLKELTQLLIDSRNEFEEIFLLSPSSFLLPIFSHIKSIFQVIPENNKYHLIDSGTFSYGLGMIVNKVADGVSKGWSNKSVSQNIRSIIPHIYGIFCFPNLTYVQQSNFLDTSQSIALDFIGTIPIFTMEDGKFSPLTKVSKKKNLIACFEDFIDEFEQPQEIIVISGNSSKPKELVSLQIEVNEKYQSTRFSFQSMNNATISIIGPKALGVFVLDRFS